MPIHDPRSAALADIRRGWYVFPLQPNSKIPAVADWESAATLDPDQVRRWWSAGRRWNIGLAVGPSNLVVVDLDSPKPLDPHGATPATSATNQINGVAERPAVADRTATDPRHGRDVFADLCHRHGQPIPANTLTVATPSDGWHLYYQHPTGEPLRNTKGGTRRSLGERIDTRAHGGYVVAPGSVLGARAYTIVTDLDPMPLPDWLTQLLRRGDREYRTPTRTQPARATSIGADRRTRFLSSAVARELDHVRHAPADRGNATLWGAAAALGQLVAGGELNEQDVIDMLEQASTEGGRRTLAEARATIRSGLRRGALRPRKVA